MKVVKSLGRLKSDLSRMLVRQQADVVFSPHGDTEATLALAASFDADARGLNPRGDAGAVDRDATVGAHLAVVRSGRQSGSDGKGWMIPLRCCRRRRCCRMLLCSCADLTPVLRYSAGVDGTSECYCTVLVVLI